MRSAKKRDRLGGKSGDVSDVDDEETAAELFVKKKKKKGGDRRGV